MIGAVKKINMEYGNIVLANTKKGLVQQAIKWFTKSKFCHGLITMPDILGTPMCIEAAVTGVDMTRFDLSYKNNPNKSYEIWQVNVPQEVKDLAIKALLQDLEVGYGFFQYPWFIWRRINLFFGKDIKAQNNWHQDGTICSELCVEYLKGCGLEGVLYEYGVSSITPQDLRNIFLSHPSIFTLIEVKE